MTPFDWNEYARLADELSKREDEASLRQSAVSTIQSTIRLETIYWRRMFRCQRLIVHTKSFGRPTCVWADRAARSGEAVNVCTTIEERLITIKTHRTLDSWYAQPSLCLAICLPIWNNAERAEKAEPRLTPPSTLPPRSFPRRIRYR